MVDNTNISVPQSGMNRDVHPSRLQKNEYSFALNATTEGVAGNVLMMQNEPSNLKASDLNGYKVVGYKRDPNTEDVYFFVTDPSNGTSKILLLESYDKLDAFEDEERICGCDILRILSQPLEQCGFVVTPQILRFPQYPNGISQDIQVYSQNEWHVEYGVGISSYQNEYDICNLPPLASEPQILLEDCIGNTCLNFQLSHPIRDIIIKTEKCGKVIYWTDGENPQRQLNLDLLAKGEYYHEAEPICGEYPEGDTTCVACNKLRIFKQMTIPRIGPESIQLGGNLKSGIYEFALALSDGLGNELSEYYSLTNQVVIFDPNNIVVDGNDFGRPTSYGIKLNVSNLDIQASHYKVAVIQTTDPSQTEEYFIIGEFTSTEKSIYYTSDLYAVRTSLEHLAIQKPVYKTANGMFTASNRLLQYGLTREVEWNLQPVVNLLGSFLYWQSSKAKESLYMDGVAVAKYSSNMREEVYPYAIRFLTKEGFQTAIFPLVPRPAIDNELDDVYANGNAAEKRNVNAALNYSPNCSDVDRRYRWQFFNTAKMLGNITAGTTPDDGECEKTYSEDQVKNVEYTYYTLTKDSTGMGGDKPSILLSDIEEWTTLTDYVNENWQVIANSARSQYPAMRLIGQIYQLQIYPDDSDVFENKPEFESVCDDPTPELPGELLLAAIYGEDLNFTWKSVGEYNPSELAEGGFMKQEMMNKEEFIFGEVNTDLFSPPDDYKEYFVGENLPDPVEEAPPIVAENIKLLENGQCITNCSCGESDMYNVSENKVPASNFSITTSGSVLYQISKGQSFAYQPNNINDAGVWKSLFPELGEDPPYGSMTGEIHASYVNNGKINLISWATAPNGWYQVYNDAGTASGERGGYYSLVNFKLTSDKYGEVIDNVVDPNNKKDTNDAIRPLDTYRNNQDVRVSTFPDMNDYKAGSMAATRFFFPRHISTDARWFKIVTPTLCKEDPEEFDKMGGIVIEFMGSSKIGNSYKDTITSEIMRVTCFTDCNGGKHFNIFDKSVGNGSIIVNSTSSIIAILTSKDFENEFGGFKKAIYVCVDSPLCYLGIPSVISNYAGSKLYVFYSVVTGLFTTTRIPYGMSIATRNPEPKTILAVFDEMVFYRNVDWVAGCQYCVDGNMACNAKPDKYGLFSYWESIERYPDNKELFDSSELKLYKKDFDGNVLSDLKKYYGVAEETDEYIVLGETANMCNGYIRHYKFPNNMLVPFMTTNVNAPFADCDIFPLGVAIQNNVVKSFLDTAVNNGYITEEQRSAIVSYEIFRGDRSFDRSIVACGMLYDMFEYTAANGKTVLTASFPYNDLSDNKLIYADQNRRDFLKHPYKEHGQAKKGNSRYVFFSPNTMFDKPDLFGECLIEGFQFGASRGMFDRVEDHPKWVIIGNQAYNWATTFATIEALANYAMKMSSVAGPAAGGAYVMVLGGMAVGTLFSYMTAVSTAAYWVAFGAEGLNQAMQWGKYRYDWLTAFINNGQRLNFAYYYSSVGHYNYFNANNETTSLLRGIAVAKYMPSGMFSTIESGITANLLNINNVDRESSVFLSFGADADDWVNYTSTVSNFDNSRVVDSCFNTITEGEQNNDRAEQITKVASPYVRIKRYIPNQYGGIENVRWVSTGHIEDIDSKNQWTVLYGGDTTISRIAFKRKFPFFHTTAMGVADMMPFPYEDYRNVAYPRYFINYDTNEDSKGIMGRAFPNRKSRYVINCKNGKFYVKGKFYLWYYGIPSFLVESDINCNYRLAGKERHQDFYPHVGDYMDWTQEKNVSIKYDNYYKINPVFTRTKSRLGYRVLPSSYERAKYDCLYQSENGVIWSYPDSSENNIHDPWLNYGFTDLHEFRSDYGKLIDMRRIESDQIMARFENQIVLCNALDVVQERTGTNPTALGTGDLFAGRLMEYNNTDIGYTGTQSKEMISCEFGHFWVDVHRGQVFRAQPNGTQAEEITTGVKYWMKKHLPFKILKYNIYNQDTKHYLVALDIDNKFLGIGISMGWDSRFKRVFLTKKDYIPVKDASLYTFSDGKFYYDGNHVELTNREYFEDMSFTIAYHCLLQRWISYYSFTPDYYIAHQDYFQTGNNFAQDYRQLGLWSHLLTFQSYQVFYGVLHPYTIEVPVEEEYRQKILVSAKLWMENRRYQNNTDFAVNENVGFNKMWIYNHVENTGQLNINIAKPNDRSQYFTVPKHKDGEEDILITQYYGVWKINHLYNRIRNDLNNSPQWLRDKNDINKVLDPRLFQYLTPLPNRLRGDWFLLRLTNDKESRFNMIMKWIFEEEKYF